MHLSATLHVIRYTVMLWQLKCLTFLLMDLLWNTNIWRVTQTVIIIPLIYSCLFPYFVRALFMHAISGKILLEKNDYHLIVTVEMMVSGKFTGVCSLSLPLPPPPSLLLVDVRWIQGLVGKQNNTESEIFPNNFVAMQIRGLLVLVKLNGC